MPVKPSRRSGDADGGAYVRRQRVTGRSVRVAERVSRFFITLGGLGTVVAVATIFGFLLWVVIPLFQAPSVGEARRTAIPASSGRAVACGTDEHGVLAWTLFADGVFEVVVRESGVTVERRPLVVGPAPTAVSISPDGKASALGFADGSVRSLSIGISTALVEGVDIPAPLRSLAVGAVQVHEGAVAQRLVGGEVRLQRPATTLGAPLALAQGAVVGLDRSDQAGGWTLVTLDADGRAGIHRVTEKTSLLARARPAKLEVQSAPLPGVGPADGGPATFPVPEGAPQVVTLPGAGDNALLIWSDGRALRYDCRDLDQVRMVESLDVVETPGARVTATAWMIGKTTLLVGDSTGLTTAWFRIKPEPSTSPDGSVLAGARHRLPGPAAAVVSLAPGQRTRTLCVAYADASARVFAVTGAHELLQLSAPAEGAAIAALAPKEDAILVRTPGGLLRWPLDLKHPEAGLSEVFGRVWYEGLPEPAHVWQSTGGTDDFEPKLGLMPLVFGTLKATLYSMLFGVPIALLAAIFTSEFLSARLRVSIKSVIEIMASLPSVVLGFLAAIVIAPFVQGVVPAVLTAFLLLPLTLLLAAHLWQLIPQPLALRLAGWPRLAAITLVFPLAILLSGWIAPGVERALFRGDLLAWLDHRVVEADLEAAGWTPPAGVVGEAREDLLLRAGAQAAGKRPNTAEGQAPAPALLTDEQVERVRDLHAAGASGGWTYLTFPIAAALVLLLLARAVNPWLRQRSMEWSRRRCALVALSKFVGGTLVALALAWLFGEVLAGLGADPRGSFDDAARGQGALMGSYVQRNALVVGFVMGFAIIPVIYTLAEDALTSVPEHLRLGSLAAGATPWQTATRIIIPTAMSGLFSAVMIGLGRAVGETMIVLMATGNTSVMEWDMFNGFRTLSANTATEMPEAVAGSTHYRVLFLSAFTLFAMTFTLNTLAESVRRRFRKRAFQL